MSLNRYALSMPKGALIFLSLFFLFTNLTKAEGLGLIVFALVFFPLSVISAVYVDHLFYDNEFSKDEYTEKIFTENVDIVEPCSPKQDKTFSSIFVDVKNESD